MSANPVADFVRAATLAGLLLAPAVPAGAVTRIRADLNSCATLQQVLLREGSAVIRYPSKRVAGLFLYDLHVSPHFRCRWPEQPVATTVPAADDPRCVVHRCEEVEPLFDLFDRPGR